MITPRQALLATSVLVLAMPSVFSQTPPPLIRVHRTPFHQSSGGFPLVYRTAGIVSVTLSPVTGPREAWQVELHGSFAGLEEADKVSPLHPNSADTRTSIAFHRNWWSSRSDDAMQALRRARFVQVTVIRIPVQAEGELNELLRARRASLDSINLDRPELVYQVLSGDYSGTFLILSPLSSLATLDEGVSRSAAAYLRSTGTPSQRSGSGNFKSDISYENLLFRVDPLQSTVTPEFAELDPAFWRKDQ